MKLRELLLKVRVNKKTGALDVNIPKKELSVKELNDIQKNKSIKFLMENS